GDVAKDYAERVAVPTEAPDAHEQMERIAVAMAGDDLAPAPERAGSAVADDAIQGVVGRLRAFGSEQIGEGTTVQFVRAVAEQRPRVAVGGRDEAGAIEQDDTVGGGVKDRLEPGLIDLGEVQLARSGGRDDSHACRRRLALRASFGRNPRDRSVIFD